MELVKARTGDPQGHTCCRDQVWCQAQGSVSAAHETRCLVSFHSPLQGWASPEGLCSGSPEMLSYQGGGPTSVCAMR